MTSSQRYLPAAGRILIAVLFIMSGIGKVMAPAGTIGYIASAHLPLPTAAYAISLMAELGGGILLILVLRSRLVAGGLALFTFAAALSFHNNFADQNQMVHFLKNVAIAGGLLQIVAFGAGSFSLDARFARRA